MNSKSLLTLFLIILLTTVGWAQKIKYKELFVLLDARQFTEAEPYLKKYLRDNDDNPNAYLFMGMIYQDKAAKMDVLREAAQIAVQVDSAVFFYEKAAKGITEKEINRNEEYYEKLYSRRDVRTGKFGVKLSDIQLDIESRMKQRDRAKQILLLRSQFDHAIKWYDKAQSRFKAIQSKYQGAKELYLQADEALLTSLRSVAQVYDSFHISFNDYRATLEGLGNTGYNQDLDPDEIVDFKKDGATAADFYKDDLKVWDYKRWALSTVEKLERDILPVKDQLLSLDVEANELQQKVKKDSVSVRSEVAIFQKKLAFPALRKIDEQPLALQIEELKVAEIIYGSQVVEGKPARDSVNLPLYVESLKKQLSNARSMDSIASILVTKDLDKEIENYKDFVSKAYGNPSLLKTYIKSSKEYAVRELVRKEDELKRKSEFARWIISGTDSIPLFAEVRPTSRFRPLVILEKFTLGFQYADSLATGYFYTVKPSRKLDVKANFPVDQPAFKKRNLPFTKSLYIQDVTGQTVFAVMYSEVKAGEKFPSTVAKFGKTGLIWSVNYGFSQLPQELVINPETNELIVKTLGTGGEVLPISFDKAGKVIK
ncbi:MAG: hypothetical protein K2U26_03400 [Cyclobacteriaceae bacterium]|nr:hypothetical protein [Cyclobacteriaceae bacterium]